MDQGNVMFFKNQDKSYNIAYLYLNHNIFFGYKDSYNYYDIDVDKILFVISDNEYIIRYNDVNKKNIVPLQLKINNFYLGELRMLPNDITLILIHSDDKELFKKCNDEKWKQIWNKNNELTGINDLANFVVTNLDGRDDFIILKLEKKQPLLEINIEMILYLFYILFLMIIFKHINSSIQILMHVYP